MLEAEQDKQTAAGPATLGSGSRWERLRAWLASSRLIHRSRTVVGLDIQVDVGNLRRSVFISRRELLLAVVLLAVGGAMIPISFSVFEPEGPVEQAAEQAPRKASGPSLSNSVENGRRTDDGFSIEDSRTSIRGEGGEPYSLESATIPYDGLPWGRVEGLPDREAENGAPAQPPLPPPDVAKLTNLQVSTRTGDLRVSLSIGERPAYKMFRLPNPKRVVVDMPGTWVFLPSDQLRQEISHPLVSRIRVGQYKASPPIARLVFHVTGFPNLLVFPHSGGLDIQVYSTTE